MTTRPISGAHYSQIQNVTRPRPMLSALWASYRTFWSLLRARIYDMVTLHPKQDFKAISPSTSLSLQNMVKAGQREDTQTNTSIKDLSLKHKKDPSESDLIEDRSEVPINPPKLSSSEFISSLRQDMNAAFTTFHQTLQRNWKKPVNFERGTIFVTGLIQLEGSKAFCTLDVVASYHPREARWVTCDFHLRQLVHRIRTPRSGR